MSVSSPTLFCVVVVAAVILFCFFSVMGTSLIAQHRTQVPTALKKKKKINQNNSVGLGLSEA